MAVLLLLLDCAAVVLGDGGAASSSVLISTLLYRPLQELQSTLCSAMPRASRSQIPAGTAHRSVGRGVF